MSVWGRLVYGAALVGVSGSLVFGGFRAAVRPGPLSENLNVVVPHGSSEVVARALRRAGVVRYAWEFRIAAAVSAWQGPLLSGELSFSARANLWQVLAVLRQGRPVEHLLTIPEGLTAWRIGEVLAAAGVLAGDVTVPREGETLPETYAYQMHATRDSVVRRARLAMDAAVARIWRERDPNLPLRSPHELVTLASVVELETHLASERPLVARVFLNRLHAGMRLQSDVTVAYGESGGRGELTGLTREMLAHANPYNSYAMSGLPAGPICSPGTASLFATAHPARSDVLYFVADGTGGHAFANGLVEHENNVARYRVLIRQSK